MGCGASSQPGADANERSSEVKPSQAKPDEKALPNSDWKMVHTSQGDAKYQHLPTNTFQWSYPVTGKPLPENWKELKLKEDSANGKHKAGSYYYQHTTAKYTQWTYPSSSEPLPEGWTELILSGNSSDGVHKAGEYYWKDPEGKQHWSPPPSSKPLPKGWKELMLSADSKDGKHKAGEHYWQDSEGNQYWSAPPSSKPLPEGWKELMLSADSGNGKHKAGEYKYLHLPTTATPTAQWSYPVTGEPLPENWKEIKLKEDTAKRKAGSYYYQHTTAKYTQWTYPYSSKPLPEGWTEFILSADDEDEAHRAGEYYWKDPEGERHWSAPKEKTAHQIEMEERYAADAVAKEHDLEDVGGSVRVHGLAEALAECNGKTGIIQGPPWNESTTKIRIRLDGEEQVREIPPQNLENITPQVEEEKPNTTHVEALRKEALEAHNKRRAMHGAPALQWSEECVNSAQKQANVCQANSKMSHGNCDGPSGRHGQNISYHPMPGPNWSVADAVESWYSEIKDYNYSSPGFEMSTGHFTQVVWKSTTHVGIGVSTDGKFIVANYLPAGNMQGAYPQNVLAKT